MATIEDWRKKNCLFFDTHDYEHLIHETMGEEIEVNFYPDYIDYGSEDDYTDIEAEDVYKALSDYFDINVTSIHTDNCDDIGIWIVYKNR